MNLKSKILAILFVVGQEGVSRGELAKAFSVENKEIEHAITELNMTMQEKEECPFEVMVFNNNYMLVTKASYEEVVSDFAKHLASSRLSKAALETLAIVAYKQPVTRMRVDEIRGVSSSSILQNLQGRDLIKEVGRLELPGRPLLYGTTDYFMNYFGLESLDDLPELEPLELETEPISESLFTNEYWEFTLYDKKGE